MTKAYVPDAGDIVWINFDPQEGSEQAGRRPAVVLTPVAYNARAGLLICCPTTTRIKNYPFEVPLAGAPASVALADHAKSLDWRQRRAMFKARATTAEVGRIKAKLATLIDL